MDLWALRALVLDLNFETHGVPIVFTAPEAERPVETRGIWSLPAGEQEIPVGSSFTRATQVRSMALKRSEVGDSPKGSEIAAAYFGESTTTWIVDDTERIEGDRVYVRVVPKADCCDD